MKNDCTPLITVKKKCVKKNLTQENMPSEHTLAFLKLFARNYHVEEKLPEGLQEIILS